jgi:hypothetical protein
MSSLELEAVAALQEAERLLAILPLGSPERDAVELTAADLRDLCGRLGIHPHLNGNDGGSVAGSSLAQARETVYVAQAHFRLLRARLERVDAQN